MDKIFVHDYLKEVEIGAFQSERDCTQRVRFNVSLEIEPLNIHLEDNVDKVLSYELILNAINLELSSQRFNLLETLAEKVADRCLQEGRVKSAEIKIEKLDRIPGSMGVSIFRNKVFYSENKVKTVEEIDTNEIILVSFSGDMINTKEMKSWLSALLSSKKKITILVDPFYLVNPFVHSSAKSVNGSAMNQVALLGMEQNAWSISSSDERFSIVSSKSELYWAAKSNKVTFFCPSYFTRNTISDVPDVLDNYDEFLVWLSKELGIAKLYLVGRDEQKLKTNTQKLHISVFNKSDWNYL